MPRFVLDHNFPYTATGIRWPPTITLTPLQEYDRRLVREHEDWQVLTELARRGDVGGYITNDTNDARMLNLPTEMVALARSRLILVVTDETGDDPLAATGLLMAYLPEIAVRERGNRHAQLDRLRPLDLGRQRDDVQKILRELADRHYAHVDQMIAREWTKIEAWTSLTR
ncbi:MAG: hypothetical protein M3O34_06895 [Chloroflexota bacterium]|nr:hypothetical protein [Chloroflexota bacterium]